MFFTSTALLGILLQNITAPTVRILHISSINLLLAGFDPLVLPTVSLSVRSAPVSLVFYSISTSTESNHILSQPLVHQSEQATPLPVSPSTSLSFSAPDPVGLHPS